MVKINLNLKINLDDDKDSFYHKMVDFGNLDFAEVGKDCDPVEVDT
jgi:hypothetical protein